MERRVLLAVGISIAILMVYQEVLQRFFPQTRPAIVEDAPPSTAPAPPSMDAPHPAAAVPDDRPAPALAAGQPAMPEKLIKVETERYFATLSTIGGRLTSIRLKHYRATVESDSPPQELILPGQGGEVPIGVELRGPQGTAVLSDAAVSYSSDVSELKLTGGEEGVVELSGTLDGVSLRKRFSFKGDTYGSKAVVTVSNAPAAYNEVALTWSEGTPPPGPASPTHTFDQVAHLEAHKLKNDAYASLGDGKVIQDVDVRWVGHSGSHFFVGMAPSEPRNPRLWLKLRGQTIEEKLLLTMSQGSVEVGLDLYTGPKDVDALTAAGHDFDRAVDLGIFWFIALPMLHVLRVFHTFTGNYGLDIILMTVIIKVLFIPLTRTSMKSMKEMQKLQPQMTQIRERFKDNSEQMNKEIMELYRKHKVNPLGGCLPMLLQIPVFIGLYTALNSAIELRHAPFFFWIHDLAAPDRLGALQIPFVQHPGIPVLTLLMGASMFLQQWMTPSMGDPTQRQMMMVMPLMMTFMFVNFPAGLSLYWLVNNVLTIVQQYLMNRNKT